MYSVFSAEEAIERAKEMTNRKRVEYINSLLTNLAGHTFDRLLTFKLEDKNARDDKQIFVFEDARVLVGNKIQYQGYRMSFTLEDAISSIGEVDEPLIHLGCYISDAGNLLYEFNTHFVEYINSQESIVTPREK